MDREFTQSSHPHRSLGTWDMHCEKVTGTRFFFFLSKSYFKKNKQTQAIALDPQMTQTSAISSAQTLKEPGAGKRGNSEKVKEKHLKIGGFISSVRAFSNPCLKAQCFWY